MASLVGDPSGKGLSGNGGSLEPWRLQEVSDSPCQATAAKEQDFVEGSDSLCQAAAAKEQDFVEGSDSLCQAAAAKEQDFVEGSDSLCQAVAAKEQDFFEAQASQKARTSADYSAPNECDIIRGPGGEVSGAKLVRVRFRCPSAKCGNHKWKRNVPESWYREGTVVCDHCKAVVPKPCVRSVEPFIDVV